MEKLIPYEKLSKKEKRKIDQAQPVTLGVAYETGALVIRQTNTTLPRTGQAESYGIGLNSIRRIARGYGGSVTVEEAEGQFGISIIFRNL